MNKRIMAAALLTGFLAMAPAAQAGGVDIGISIGIPGIILGGPAYYPPPPPHYRPYYERPRVIVVPERVVVPVPRYYYQPGWNARGRPDHHQRKYWNNSWKGHGGHYGHGRGWRND